MHRVLTSIALTMIVPLLAVPMACADDDPGIERLTTTTPTTTTTVTRPTNTTGTRTDPGSTASTQARGLAVQEAISTCGTADGPWIEVTLTAARPTEVVVTFVADGTSYGRSAPHTVAGTDATVLGFDPAFPGSGSQARGMIKVRRTDDAHQPVGPPAVTAPVTRPANPTGCGWPARLAGPTVLGDPRQFPTHASSTPELTDSQPNWGAYAPVFGATAH